MNGGKSSTRISAVVLALCGLMCSGHAGYMQAKAALAQILLQRAWQQSLAGGQAMKPWPWADTTPIARLRVARLGVDEIVLSGDSGRTLAFGPGWTESSARPGAPGVSIVSAHRDTHFTFLRDLDLGDRIEVETTHGTHRFRIQSMRIADADHERIQASSDVDALVLITCYPFDTLNTGGPLRYVVTAVRVSASASGSNQDYAAGSPMSSMSSTGGGGGKPGAPRPPAPG